MNALLKTGDTVGYVVLTSEGEIVSSGEEVFEDVLNRKSARWLKKECERLTGDGYRIAKIVLDK